MKNEDTQMALATSSSTSEANSSTRPTVSDRSPLVEIHGDNNTVIIHSNVAAQPAQSTTPLEVRSSISDGTNIEISDVNDELAVSRSSTTTTTAHISNSTDHHTRWRVMIDLVKEATGNDRKEVDGGRLYYSKKTKIADGSQGNQVYLGLYDGKPVAVKKSVSGHGKKNTAAESLVGQSFEHLLAPICIIEDEVIDYTYFVLDLCEYTLQEVIEEKSNPLGSTLTPARHLDICEQLLRGLEELHGRDIIHRDLKPANVLFDRNWKVVIADVGESRQLSDTTTIVTQGVGTMCWMPKEVLNAIGSDVRYKKSADIWVAGCLLYYVLSGGHIPHEKTYPYQRDYHAVTENIRKDSFSFKHLYEHSRYETLLRDMIDPCPAKRPKISGCLQRFAVTKATEPEKPGPLHGSLQSSTIPGIIPGLLPMIHGMETIQPPSQQPYGPNRAPVSHAAWRNFNPVLSADIASELLLTHHSMTAHTIIRSKNLPIQLKSTRPQHMLEYMGAVTGLDIAFTDYPQSDQSEFLTELWIATDPPVRFQSTSNSIEAAHDMASLEVLRALAGGAPKESNKVVPLNGPFVRGMGSNAQ